MDEPPELEVGLMAFIVLGGTIVIKAGLYLWCKAVIAAVGSSSSVEAYAQVVI